MNDVTATRLRERIAPVVAAELDGDERLLAATRVVLPINDSKYDENGKERSELRRLALVQHVLVRFRPPPPPVAGFPVHWDMVLCLTRHRVLVWKPRRGSAHPTQMLGAVPLAELELVKLTTVPARGGGRTLAVKIALRHGPRMLFDVMAGFRTDSEEFAEEAQHQIEVRRFLG
jgi:hypothetical protein